MLEVKNISKYYGDKAAISNISFKAEEGQVIGLLGHNGSGKSTTMKIITNCLLPTAGDVFVDGISVTENPILAKKKIGYLPEVPPVYPDMTVDEQLHFACGLRSIPGEKQNEEINRACEDLNIQSVRHRLINNLSKGYRQRVGFAQAIIGRPPLLVLDEPTVGLDPQQIIEIRELIGRLRKEHTVILSSHILSEIALICDRLVILSNGHLNADDTLDGLIASCSEKADLLLQADGDEKRLLRVIRSVPGVVDCTVETGADGSEYKIETDSHSDIHKELFRALSEADCPIRTLKPLKPSLEEVFIRLTGDRCHTDEEKEGIGK